MIDKRKYSILIGGVLIVNTALATHILTLDQDTKGHLTTKCQAIDFTAEGFVKIKNITSALQKALKPHLPAAGLAAPQIGLNQRIFLFSWDRTEEHLISVTNPSFEPVGEEKEFGWEGCFSIILGNGPYQVANVPRYKKIKVAYRDQEGKLITQILEGFAARVFQHEYDHLEGIENIHRADAEIKTFETREALLAFMNEIKQNDKARYIQPQVLTSN